MPEPDVVVGAALEMDRQKFLDDLRAAQQDIEAFIAKVESLQANLNVNVRLDVARASLEAFIREFEARGINLPVNVGGGGAVGNGITNIFNTFSVSNFSATQNNLNSQFSQAMSQFFQFNQSGGGGGSGGSGGGGGNGYGRFYGLSRFFTGYYATRELMRIGEAERQYAISTDLAAGDPAKQYQAEEKLIGSFPWGNLIVDPFGSAEIERQQIVGSAQFQDVSSEATRQLRIQTAQLNSESQASGVAGVSRATILANSRFQAANAAIDKKRAAEAAPFVTQREQERQAIIEQYNRLKNDASIGNADRPDLQAQSLATLDAELSGKLSGVDQKYSAMVKPIDDYYTQQRDAEALLRDNAIRDAQADQLYRNAASGTAIGVINESLSQSRLGITGQSQAAERQAFAFGLQKRQQELDAQAQRAAAVGNYEEFFNLRGQQAALSKAAPELIANNSASINARETLATAQNQTAIGAIGASANEALLRSTGNVSESERQAIEREGNDRVKNLRDEAEALKTVNQADSERKTALANATEEANNIRLRAFDQAQALRSLDAVSQIGDTTTSLRLRATGQTYQAEEQAADARYNRQIEQLRRDPNRRAEADALEQERDAARAARGFGRTENAHRIQANADTLSLTNQHRDAEAELSQIEESYRASLVNAGGDPQAVAAIENLHRQQLQHFAQNNVTGASVTNLRSIFFGLQAASAGDPTGARGRSAVNARAAALRELSGANGPTLMEAPWNAGASGISDILLKRGHGAGTDPYLTDPFGSHGKLNNPGDSYMNKMDGTADKIGRAADKLANAVDDLVSV